MWIVHIWTRFSHTFRAVLFIESLSELYNAYVNTGMRSMLVVIHNRIMITQEIDLLQKHLKCKQALTPVHVIPDEELALSNKPLLLVSRLKSEQVPANLPHRRQQVPFVKVSHVRTCHEQKKNNE